MINIQKRDGRAEPLSEEKYNRVVMWVVEGVENVSASAIALGASASIFNGMTTSQLHEALVKAAADLISPETPNYSQVAARLNLFKMRKDAFGQYEYPDLYMHIVNLVNRGIYDEDLLKRYHLNEINELGKYLDTARDDLFGYAATVQLQGKYLVQNRVTGKIHEAPQHIYMLVGMCLFQDWQDGTSDKTRLEMVKGFYDVTSTFKLSLPTPIMAGVRTPTRQFSSCVLIESGDSLKAINGTAAAIVDYVSQRAGIGISFGRIRALGSEIRGGEATHTGVIPFLKHFQTAVKSCSQGGVRGGAATAYYPFWHLETESLLVLKNNRGVDENRVPAGFSHMRDMPDVAKLSVYSNREVAIIGGAEIYRLAMPYVHRVYLTHLDVEVPDADTFFPMEEMAAANLISLETLVVQEETATTPAFKQVVYGDKEWIA